MLALNYSKFQYEFMQNKVEACKICEDVLKEANADQANIGAEAK